MLAFAQRLMVEQAPVLAAKAAAAKTPVKSAARAAAEASAMKDAAAKSKPVLAPEDENISATEASATAVIASSEGQDCNVEAVVADSTSSSADVNEESGGATETATKSGRTSKDIMPVSEAAAAAAADGNPMRTTSARVPWAAAQRRRAGKKTTAALALHEWLPPGPRGTLRGGDGRAAVRIIRR